MGDPDDGNTQARGVSIRPPHPSRRKVATRSLGESPAVAPCSGWGKAGCAEWRDRRSRLGSKQPSLGARLVTRERMHREEITDTHAKAVMGAAT